MSGRGHPRRRLALGTLLGMIGVLLVPGLAAAHPLGNFTINHYTGIRVEPARILLDVVIDEAEIPAFQARLDFDTDGDGEVSDAETDVGRGSACQKLAPSLALTVDGTARALAVVEAGLSFPPGVGGLSTMRLVCGFAVSLGAPLTAGSTIGYTDGVVPGSPRLARDRRQRVRRHARGRGRRRPTGCQHLGAADALPDQPAGPGTGRHVGRHRRDARRADPRAARHRRR